MSFIASLAAVGTAVGVTGAIAAPLAGAGILAAGGAGLGAATSAAMGGDPGEGALMGAVTAPLMAPLMPAVGAAAPATQAGTQVAAQTGANVAAQTGANVGAQGIGQLAANPLVNATTTQVVPQTISNTANAALTKLPEIGWGQSLVGNALNVPVTGTAANIGGTALQQGVYGAGIGALGSGLTGQDIGKGAGIGFLGGAVGGAGQSALASQAGTATGALGTAAKFAAESPTITSGLISVPTSMALNSMMAPEAPTLPSQNQPKSQFKWSGPSSYNYSPETYTPNTPQWNVYRPQYYAAGGITDLDGYASQAQNIAAGGITQIPNPAEVADPEGYGQESVRMMAGGGMTKIADALVQSSPIGLIAGWDSASELPLIGGLFDKPEALPATATLSPEEKQKLMAMMAAQQGQQQMVQQQPQQMARGGIADLGDYAAGGRPNLLHGAGDGVSDDIPASIAGKQPARLAAGEYVIPSRIVSELGNGSTDAGAKRLDEMVQKIQAGRKKTMGSKKQFATDSKAYKHLPA